MLKILHVSAEVAPFVNVGGLSQVMSCLPSALRRRKLDVRLFTPRYGKMRLPKGSGLLLDVPDLEVPVGRTVQGTVACRTFAVSHKDRRLAPVWLLDNPEYFGLRANVYGYHDDSTRFALLSRGCLEWVLIQMDLRDEGKRSWVPDVIHCHDWHTAILAEMARRDPRYRRRLRGVRIVLNVHNFAYQGAKTFKYLPEGERDSGRKALPPILSPDLDSCNFLLRGLLRADSVMTVSPTHAREILTPEYSEGLLPTLRRIRSRLGGIMNGLDTEEFNPATDRTIARRFDARTLKAGKAANKARLQRLFSLPNDPKAFVFSYHGRLAGQKGIDLLVEAAPHVFAECSNSQLVVMGGGDERFRKALYDLKERFPRNVGLHLYPDFRLPRQIMAGTDVHLMPSAFEPGGIVALEAMRYGAVPIVRRTGGLCDTVSAFDPATGLGNGFLFSESSPWSLFRSLTEAMTVYSQPKAWEKVVRNAFAFCLTWDDAAESYEAWYRQALKGGPKGDAAGGRKR